ncbi:MAG TPA: phosphoribosyltransferase family protein [Rubricoccaceae bacterium]|jgi:ComF family protein
MPPSAPGANPGGPERHNRAARNAARGAALRARAAVHGAAAALAGLVYPSLCLGCDRRLPDAAGGAAGDPLAGLPLCPTCLAALPAAPPLDVAALSDARAGGVVVGAVALWTYDAGGAVRRVQHALKYGGRERIGVPLGHLLASAVRRAGTARIDLVVPVPLASVRLLERGYNQSAALAEGAAAALGAEYRPERLVRTRSTRTQTALTAAQRRANVDGAFAVPHPEALTGLHVLLVDDVLTTGATLIAAARPLAEAGATVTVAALAAVA